MCYKNVETEISLRASPALATARGTFVSLLTQGQLVVNIHCVCAGVIRTKL